MSDEPEKPALPVSTPTNTVIRPPAGSLTLSSAVDTVDEALAGNFVPLIRRLRGEEPLTARERTHLVDDYIQHHRSSLPKTVEDKTKPRTKRRLPKIVEKEIREQQMAHQVGELITHGIIGEGELYKAWEEVAAYSKPPRSADVVRRAWQRWGKKTTITPGSTS